MVGLLVVITIVLFIFGASIGSFLDALAIRIHTQENFIHARSKCDHCGHVLSAKDLIPIVSFLLIKGRCRYCGTRLARDLFFAELLLGILFVACFYSLFSLFIAGNTFIFYGVFVFKLSMISLFFYIALYDLKYFIISDEVVYGLSGLLIFILVLLVVLHICRISLFVYANYYSFLLQHIATGVVLFLLFLAIYLATKGRGIGGGDVKLVFPIGLLLGVKPSIIFLYVSFFTGAIVSLMLLATKKRHMKDAIPFGPFLAFGVIIAILYSGVLLQTQLFSFLSLFNG